MITREDIVDGAVFINPNYEDSYPKCLLGQFGTSFRLIDPATNESWDTVLEEEIDEMVEVWNEEGIQKWTGNKNA